MIKVRNIILILVVPLTFWSCITHQNKMKDWSVEFVVKKKITFDSYYVNSKGEGIRMIRDVDCNVQLEKYDYEKNETLKVYSAIASLQNINVDWACLDESIKDGVDAKILFREGNVEKTIELPYSVIEQNSDEFMKILLLFESIAKDKKREIILENDIVLPPPIPN